MRNVCAEDAGARAVRRALRATGAEEGSSAVSDNRELVAENARLLEEAEQAGGLTKYRTYLRLSGPGWLQSAITLGGGSLAGSLYLGVLGGYELLWLQPIAMLFGIVMLSAIGYVTLSTGERPFHAIRIHINPVLAWGWALAALAANMVWVLPQYSLATGVLQQNLLPGLLGEAGTLGDTTSKVLITGIIFVTATAVTWNYGSGGYGVRLFERIVKLMVALIVLCFFGVVVRLAMAGEGGIPLGAVLAGFIPNPSLVVSPSVGFQQLLDATGPDFGQYWRDLVVGSQRDVMVTVAATAVGINMTFLFGYSMLQRGWGKSYRGFLKFDLGTGMLIPFILTTSCVVIAASSQFHLVPQPGFVDGDETVQRSTRHEGQFEGLLAGRVAAEIGQAEADALSEEEMAARIAALPEADRYIAATLLTRDAFDLARALQPLTGDFFGRVLFGLGVLGMTLSTITLLMLISGFVICEIFRLPHTGWPFRIGTLAAATGVLGPFLWGQASFWLVVPTSVFGFMLIPIAYLTFSLMMNQRSLLGKEMPRGARRVVWNLFMGTAVVITSTASVWMVWDRAGVYGLSAVGLFLLAALVAHFVREAPAPHADDLE